MDDQSFRDAQIREFETEAEILVAHQIDLLAQLEAQLRAVHHTMRGIERLRSVNSRVGPELTNGERKVVLAQLTEELNLLDEKLLVQHESSREMQAMIGKMQGRLVAVKRAVKKRLSYLDSGA